MIGNQRKQIAADLRTELWCHTNPNLNLQLILVVIGLGIFMPIRQMIKETCGIVTQVTTVQQTYCPYVREEEPTTRCSP